LSQDEQVIARDKFLALKRVLLAYKRGQYNEENVLYFFAGFCNYVPTEEDVKI